MSVTWAKWELELDQHGRHSKVVCDGVELKGVISVHVVGGVNEPPQVIVRQYSHHVKMTVLVPNPCDGTGCGHPCNKCGEAYGQHSRKDQFAGEHGESLCDGKHRCACKVDL